MNPSNDAMADPNIVKDMFNTMKEMEENEQREMEEREMQEIKAKIALYEEKNAELAVKIDEMDVKYDADLKYLENMKKWYASQQIPQRTEHVAKYNDVLAAMDVDSDQASAKELTDLSDRLSALTVEMAKKKANEVELRAKVDALQKEKAELRKMLAEKRKTNAAASRLEAEIAGQTKEVAALEKEMADMEKEMADMEKEMAVLDANKPAEDEGIERDKEAVQIVQEFMESTQYSCSPLKADGNESSFGSGPSMANKQPDDMVFKRPAPRDFTRKPQNPIADGHKLSDGSFFM